MAQDPRDDYPIDLHPPDIAPYRRGNTGIEYIAGFDAPAPGPHVMITAVVHGNELCGAIALENLFESGIRPRRGTLSLGFMNVDAYLRFDPERPNASRFVDEDFNRVWSETVLDDPERDSVELRRARAVRPYLDTVDLLLDIHSMQHATAPLMLSGPEKKGRDLARAVGVPETVVADAGHAAGRRMRDYGDFASPASERNALLVECGQHWERSAGALATQAALRFLLATGTVDPETAAPLLHDTPPPAQRFIQVTEAVTIETDDFEFAADYRGLEVIPVAGTVIAQDGVRPVATPYDDCVLIMPSRRLTKGNSAVRLGRFVEA